MNTLGLKYLPTAGIWLVAIVLLVLIERISVPRISGIAICLASLTDSEVSGSIVFSHSSPGQARSLYWFP